MSEWAGTGLEQTRYVGRFRLTAFPPVTAHRGGNAEGIVAEPYCGVLAPTLEAAKLAAEEKLREMLVKALAELDGYDSDATLCTWCVQIPALEAEVARLRAALLAAEQALTHRSEPWAMELCSLIHYALKPRAQEAANEKGAAAPNQQPASLEPRGPKAPHGEK